MIIHLIFSKKNTENPTGTMRFYVSLGLLTFFVVFRVAQLIIEYAICCNKTNPLWLTIKSFCHFGKIYKTIHDHSKNLKNLRLS